MTGGATLPVDPTVEGYVSADGRRRRAHGKRRGQPKRRQHGADAEDRRRAVVLRDPAAGPEALPTNRQVAHRLGWPITKFNRKLDYLCQRLTKDGVPGLQGGRGTEATNRRWRLVEHAVNARLVTPGDLRSPDRA